jgi:hypothetical protein
MSGHKGIILQQRDLHLLREVAVMRIVDRDCAMLVGGFHSISRVNTRLLALTRAGLLRRFFLGSGGGRKAVYALSMKGAKLIEAPYRGPRRPQGALLVADNFVQHQLAVNDLYCVVKYRPAANRNVSFLKWLAFYQPITPELALIPDGYMELLVSSTVFPCFVEVDLGHESLSIWQEKARNYVQLAASKVFQEQFGHDVFGVLVVLSSLRRLHSIRGAVALVTDKLCRFATLEDTKEQLFGNVWYTVKGDSPKSLFEKTT